jgi:hypothetical protein
VRLTYQLHWKEDETTSLTLKMLVRLVNPQGQSKGSSRRKLPGKEVEASKSVTVSLETLMHERESTGRSWYWFFVSKVSLVARGKWM